MQKRNSRAREAMSFIMPKEEKVSQQIMRSEYDGLLNPPTGGAVHSSNGHVNKWELAQLNEWYWNQNVHRAKLSSH
jgi:hypothetical protein